MPAIVRCPECEHQLRVPDQLLGKRVKCPHCGKGFSTEQAMEEESPPPSKGKEPLASGKRPVSPSSPEKRNSERTPPEEKASRRSIPAKSEQIQDQSPLEERQDFDEEDDDEDREEEQHDRDDEHEEEEETPRPRRRSGNYARISKGLTFILTAVLVNAISKLMLGIGAIIVLSMVGQGFASGTDKGLATGLFAGGMSFIILMVLYGLSGLVNNGLWITGEILCLKSPQKHASKTLVTICLILLSIGVVFSLCGEGGFLMQGQSSSSNLTAPSSSALGKLLGLFGGLGGLGLMAHFAVFMFYLRSLALNCRAQSLAKGVVYYLIALGSATLVMILSCCAMIALFFAGVGGMAAASKGGQSGAGVAGLMATSGILGLACIGLGGIMALGFFVWYVVIIIQVRNVVAQRA